MSKPLRVAILARSFPTIPETFVLQHATALLDRGHHVDVYARVKPDMGMVHEDFYRYKLDTKSFYVPEVSGGFANRALALGRLLISGDWAKDTLLFCRALNFFRFGRRALTLRLLMPAIPFFGRGPYDVVHVHFGTNGQWALDLKRIGAIRGKLVVTFHGYDVNVWPRRVGPGCYRALFERADIVTVGSDFMARRVIELGADAGKLVKLPVGVDLSKYKFRNGNARNTTGQIVLTVARLVEGKGVSYSLRAFARALTQCPAARYLIIGDGDQRTLLEALAASLGIANSVYFLGSRTADEVKEVLETADIFLLNSVVGSDGSEEGQGLALAEAQAVGLPVVATRIGGIPESVLDGKSGFLVPERDVDAIANSLVDLLLNPELRYAMGKAGRRHVEHNFDSTRLADTLVSLYRKVSTGAVSTKRRNAFGAGGRL